MASKVIKGVYYPSGVSTSIPPSSIPKLFTHIYYAFIIPNNQTFEFDNLDPKEKDLILNFTSTIHAMNPAVKTLFATGGAAVDDDLFSRMAHYQDLRKKFILSSIKLAREFHFDGIDLDWKFPANFDDMKNLGYLLDEWREEVNNEAISSGSSPLLLTAAVYYSPELSFDGSDRSYPSDSIKKNLDWINVMTYDYYSSLDTNSTGAHAQLFDPRGNTYRSTSQGLQSWLQTGVPRNKLIIGLPLFGKTWKLKDPRATGIGAPAVGAGPGNNGSMTYSEIIDYNSNNNANVVYDPQTVSHYSVDGTNWLGYDDTNSVTEKIKYAQTLEIGGYFFWAIDGDRGWIISNTASNLW